MGKDHKNKNFKRNQKPYQKDGWKNKKNRNTKHWNETPKGRDAQKPKQEYQPKVNLREDQVGITEFVSAGAGFTGVVKSRFSDFHVNEIDLNGKVLQLNDLSVPKQEEETLSAEEVELANKELKNVITEDMWDKIKALSGAKTGSEDDKPIEIDVSSLDKEQRKTIHQMIKKLYVGKLVSTTVNQESTAAEAAEKQEKADKQEQKLIKIMKPKGGRDQNRNRWTFPGEYVHFLVHKANMDTSEVATAIATRMNMRPSQVSYCGTKDRRAKTTQKFCIKRRNPGQILGAAKIYNVHVGNFEFSNEVLKLGDLKGNRFRIVLRHITGDQADIEKALESLRERGFINYFGLQRFGNDATVPTYEVGVALMKSDYKTACELILKPRDNDLHFMRQIRETWWKDRNSAAAAAMFRNDKFIEKKLLSGLAQYGENDYAGALRKLPRNMLLLYPHAFQSLVFNRVASRRIKEFGLEVMPGDLVYRNKDELDVDIDDVAVEDEPTVGQEEAEATVSQEKAEPTVVQEEAVAEVAAVEKDENESKVAESAAANAESIFKRKVKALTADDIASGNYTLFDVVLPLPGYDVTYPDNIVGEYYTQILAEYGLSSEKLRHNVKTYAMGGAYRRLLIKPTEMSWEFRDYSDPQESLIESDWELLQRQKPQEQKEKEKQKATDTDSEQTFKALLLDFCLPTATYATMMLRELLKRDTSAASQTELEKHEMQKSNEQKDPVAEVAEAAVPEKRKADKDAGEQNAEEDVVAAKKLKSDEANGNTTVA